MIRLILDAYIAKIKTNKKMSKLEIFILVLIIAMLVLCPIFLYCIFAFHKMWAIGYFLSFILLIGACAFYDKKLRDRTNERFYQYNARLDMLKDILMSFNFVNCNTNKNETWYSPERMKYLINMCDNLINTHSIMNNKIFISLKPSIFAIFSFASGIIVEKASLKDSLEIVVFATFIVICIGVFIKFDEILDDIFFKSNSQGKIMELKSDLIELLIRDFPKSVDLELKEVIKAN